MWILEIEDADSNVNEWTFDQYSQADNFLMKYLSSHHVSDHHIGRMYATEDCAKVLTGDLVEESGEFYFDKDDSFHANYTITRMS